MKDPGLLARSDFRRELAEHVKIIRSYTHAIVMMKCDDLDGFGTGVAFRAGKRLFLITAGHNLVDQSFEVHFFAGRNIIDQGRGMNSHFHADWEDIDAKSDMGFIELKDRPDLSACALEQLHIGLARPVQPQQESIS